MGEWDRPTGAEIPLSGDGPLSGAAQATPTGDAPRGSRRAAVILAAFAAAALVAVGATAILGGDGPAATPADTTLSPVQIGTLLTTPPTLPPPTTEPPTTEPRPVTRPRPTAPPRTSLPDWTFPVAAIPLNAHRTSIDEVLARLNVDLPRRSTTITQSEYWLNPGDDVFDRQLEEIIERDPTNDRYRITHNFGDDHLVRIYDLADGTSYSTVTVGEDEPTEWSAQTMESEFGATWSADARITLDAALRGAANPTILSAIGVFTGRYYDLSELGYGIVEGFEFEFDSGAVVQMYVVDASTIVVIPEGFGATGRKLQTIETTVGSPIELPDPSMIIDPDSR